METWQVLLGPEPIGSFVVEKKGPVSHVNPQSSDLGSGCFLCESFWAAFPHLSQQLQHPLLILHPRRDIRAAAGDLGSGTGSRCCAGAGPTAFI